MTYQDFITDIIVKYGQHRKAQQPQLLLERHHIIPRCIGGQDVLQNLIDLTPREHYLAHQLLAQENPDNIKLVCAWHYMSIIKSINYQVTAEEYEASRQAIIQAQGKPVYQLSRNGDILAVYPSTREAGRALGCSNTHIAEVCNHTKGRYTTQGYCWQYVDDYIKNGFYDISNHTSTIKRPVDQLDTNNHIIATYASAAEAARKTHIDASSITSVCKGKLWHNTAGGFKWRYHTEFDN